jgi:hypothetical protein
MNDPASPRTRTLLASLILGLLGGVALIGTWLAGPFLVDTLHLPNKGFWIFVPYGALLIATTGYLYSQRIVPFLQRLAFGTAVYLIATLCASVYMVIAVNRAALRWPLSSQLGLLVLQVGIGIAVGILVAAFSRHRPHSPGMSL